MSGWCGRLQMEGEGAAGGEGHLLLLVAGGIAEGHRGGAGEAVVERHLGHLPLAPVAVYLHTAAGAESGVAAGVPEVRQGGEARKCRMSDEDWKTIFTHADAVFDNFTVRLRGQFPALNEEDIRYCCMVRMHLSQAEIASVVCLEKDSVKKRLKRIRTEKLASAKGSTLEEILSRL